MKLWQKDKAPDKKIEEFTIGRDRELDLLLAEYDIFGSLAHTEMLESINLLTKDEKEKLHAGLKEIYKEIEEGKFEIREGIEDVHSQVELLLTERLGEIGKKIHSGRSRNDQVLVDLKLYIRAEIKHTVEKVKKLFDRLALLSEEHKDTLLPGYTHLQVAMPSSFGLWFGAHAESLVDDLEMMIAAFRISNKNPLGSAAGYGSSFPLDREMTTRLLGFDDLNYNAVYAQMGRGKTEKNVSMALASVAGTLNRLAMDVTLYMSQNFGFITFPDQLTTGSSIMPHKKNPDVFELIRARSNKVQALPNEITLITGNLPSGYHRDLQLIKENFLPAFENLQDCLDITEFMLENIIVNKDILKDKDLYQYLFTVELVNQRVQEGVPFREAYKEVGMLVEEGKFERPENIEYTHTGSIGNPGTDKIRAKMDEVISRFGFEKMEKALEKLIE